MNSDNRFNRRQQLALGTVIMLSPALRLFPSQSVIMAGRASWLCAAAAVPLLLAWLYFMSSFMSHRQRGEGLPELILRTLGPIAGKITLAVRLGDARSRLLFTVLLTLPVLYTILIAFGSWAALVALVYIPFALKSVRTVNRGAKGKELIPVLGLTGRAMLIWAVLSALAVAVV